jgi:hypothetical protein
MIRSVVLSYHDQDLGTSSLSLSSLFRKQVQAPSDDSLFPKVALPDRTMLYNGIWQLKVSSIITKLKHDISTICQVTSPWIQQDIVYHYTTLSGEHNMYYCNMY